MDHGNHWLHALENEGRGDKMREWEEEARGGEGEGKREERVGRKGVRGGEEGGKRRGGKRQEVREGGGKGREKGVGEEETGEWRKMEDERSTKR